MNQGKLEVVKQEMARVNIDILGISELKWTEMGEFNSYDHYIYYYHSQQKSLKCITWMQFQKRQNDLCSFPCKTFNITVIEVYAPTINAEGAEVEWFYEDYKTF